MNFSLTHFLFFEEDYEEGTMSVLYKAIKTSSGRTYFELFGKKVVSFLILWILG